MEKSILIVEDNKAHMDLFKAMLRTSPCQIIESMGGVDVIDLAREHRPDLIIMDIQLPKISGVEHIKELRADGALKNIPILVVTAFVMKGDEEMFKQAGCDAYIPKPVRAPLFLQAITDLIG